MLVYFQYLSPVAMSQIRNFAQLIIERLKTPENQIILKFPVSSGETHPYTGSEIIEEVMLRFKQLKHKSRDAIILMDPGPDFLFWLLAIQLRGISVSLVTKSELSQTFLYGPRRSYILSFKDRPLLAIYLMLLGHRVIWKEKRKKVPRHKIDENPKQAALKQISTRKGKIESTIVWGHDLLLRQHEILDSSLNTPSAWVHSPLFLQGLLHQLASGKCSVLPPIDWDEWPRFFPGDVLDHIENEGVQSMSGTLHYFQQLLAVCLPSNFTFPGVETLILAGSLFPEYIIADIIKTFPSAKIHLLYAIPQVLPISMRHYQRKRDPLLGYCIGRPTDNLLFDIVTEGTIRVAKHELAWGAIQVQGKLVAQSNGSDVVLSGDYGYLLEGELYLIACEANKTSLDGYFPFQIEHHLHDITEVLDIAILFHEEQIWAFYASNTPAEDEITKALNALMPSRTILIKKLHELPKDNRFYSVTDYAALREGKS